MRKGFLVDKEYSMCEKNIATDIEVIGPRNCKFTVEELKKGHPFKMYDDDGILYYSGYLIGDKTCDDGFIPLDCYGTPNAGAVSIHYINDNTGNYEEL